MKTRGTNWKGQVLEPIPRASHYAVGQALEQQLKETIPTPTGFLASPGPDSGSGKQDIKLNVEQGQFLFFQPDAGLVTGESRKGSNGGISTNLSLWSKDFR